MAEKGERTDAAGTSSFKRSLKDGYSATMQLIANTPPSCAAMVLAWSDAQKQ
jgi:hypothetical protein